MGVIVSTKPAFSLETPKVIFREIHDYSGMDVLKTWGISSDGKRILTVKEAPGDTSKEGRLDLKSM